MTVPGLGPCDVPTTTTLVVKKVSLSEVYRPPTPEEMPQPPPITCDTTSNVPLSPQGKSYFKGIECIVRARMIA